MRPCPLEIEHSHKLQEDYVLQATQLMTSTDVRRMMECRYSWDLSQGATPFVIQKAYIFGEIFVHSRSSTRDCHLYACDGWLKHHPQPLTRGLLAEKGACRLYPGDHDGTQSPIKLSLLLKSPLMFAANYISSRHIMSKYVRPVFIPWFSACIPYISIPTISQLFSQLIVPSPSADVSYISFILHYSRLFDMIHLERYADRLIDRQTDLYTELWTFCKYTHACVLFHVYYININIYIYYTCVCVSHYWRPGWPMIATALFPHQGQGHLVRRGDSPCGADSSAALRMGTASLATAGGHPRLRCDFGVRGVEDGGNRLK